jgi:glycosyltransferase involved in cell wall biosynthesis
MRIAVDGRELAPHPTGVGRYLLEILQAWAADPAAADCEVTVYGPGDLALTGPRLEGPGARITGRTAGGLTGTAWEQIQLPLALLGRTDVLYAPAYSAPAFAPAPVVLTIHDVSFFAHPEWFPPREGLRRRATCRVAAANAATVLTDSRFSAAEIVRWLGLPPGRVRAIPLGVSAGVQPVPEAAPASAPHSVPGPVSGIVPGTRAPLVLCVGTFLNRRHLPDLIRAFAPLARADARARLVLVGGDRTWPRQDLRAAARDAGVAGAVDIRPWVSDAELAALYGAATAFAWLSTYEGFGLPPLEAMAAGVPVVAYDTAVAREVYDAAATLVPVGDVEAVTTALRALCLDETVRDAHRAAGLRRIRRFDWAETAGRTLAALREAAS